jgi:hypothetical protein
MTDATASDVFDINLNFDDLRIREIEDIEEITGQPISQIMASGQPMAKALRAIAYVMKRREDPEFTLEQAGELRINLTEGDAVDPTNAAGS